MLRQRSLLPTEEAKKGVTHSGVLLSQGCAVRGFVTDGIPEVQLFFSSPPLLSPPLPQLVFLSLISAIPNTTALKSWREKTI